MSNFIAELKRDFEEKYNNYVLSRNQLSKLKAEIRVTELLINTLQKEIEKKVVK